MPTTAPRYTEDATVGIIYTRRTERVEGRTVPVYRFYSGRIGGGNIAIGTAVRHKAPGGGKVSYFLRNTAGDPIGTFELANLAAVGRYLKALPSNNGAWKAGQA